MWHDNHGAAHCAACHRTFTSTRAFDTHRVDNGCVDPGTYLRRDGRRMFAARADATGAPVWEHVASAQKARDRFNR